MKFDQNILIVEDDYTISYFTRSLLLKKGFNNIKVIAAGEDAVEFVNTVKPDLILMDILLEGELDGIQTAEIIQRKYRIPVIYMTANSDAATVERAESTYTAGFIKKPFMPADLYYLIEKALAIKIL